MIRNLNLSSFKNFGIVCTEHSDTYSAYAKSEKIETLQLASGNVPVFQAVSEVWLHFGLGGTVLSVSSDGQNFTNFYLDKIVRIQPGIFFCLAPFLEDSSSVEIYSLLPPNATGLTQQSQNFHVQHRLWVTDLYTFFYHEKEKGFFFPGESHSMLELTYVDQGQLHSIADGRDTLLTQGNLVFYGPNQWHMQYADMNVAPRYLTISFDAEGCDVSKLIDRKFHVSQKAANLLQQLIREQEQADEYSTDVIISLLNMLLLTVLRQEDAPPMPLQTSNSVHSENEIIRRAQQHIGAHIREKLTVPMVAHMAGVSPSYLTALFQKNLQISPGEYIRRIRLQESKVMIREGHMNFSAIAAALQYSTVHHFSRQFKDKFGITPTEYARTVR